VTGVLTRRHAGRAGESHDMHRRAATTMAGPPPESLDIQPEELARVEMLGSLPAEALTELADRAEHLTFRAGEVVFNEGDEGRSLLVVRRGLLKVVRPAYGELVLQRLEPGIAFGELAVLNSTPRSASVVAIEDSEVIEVHQQDFDRVLDRHPVSARRMLGLLARSLTMAKEDVARQKGRLEETVRERTAHLRETQLEVVRRLSQAAESRDNETGGHIIRMSRICARLSLAAGATPEEAELILHAAPMHDVGKIAIPDRVLLKPGKLDEEEWELMKQHTVLGAELLSGSRSPVVQMGELIALTHHEKWDGNGYPRGLRGTEIPFVARVVAVCDVFDALISERPYKRPWSTPAALAEIKTGSGSHFDPYLVDVFEAMFSEVVDIVDAEAREARERTAVS
jgi:HD-GYP domain-containing protein (c-di-GMP phosphodiesterase class II)